MNSTCDPHNGRPCFECELGRFIRTPRDFSYDIPEFGEVTIKNVPSLVCCLCGDAVFDRLALLYLEREEKAFCNNNIQKPKRITD